MIDLITSLPPGLRRFDASGAPIGEGYQEHCVRSWLEAGFSVTSVNAPAELERLPRRFAGVRYLATESRARKVTGRHNVRLAALLDAARNSAAERIAITNADIFIDARSPVLQRAATLRRGQALLAKRRDVSAPDQREGLEYYWGYDLFLVHRSDLEDLDGGGMSHGEPWWDYYLPLRLFLRGVRTQVVRDALAFHLRHEERWDDAAWRRQGLLYSRFALDHRPQMPQTIARRVRGRGRRLRLTALGARPLRARLARFLYRLAVATVDFIDER